MSISPNQLIEPTFWRQPLADRMAQFADLREQGSILPVEVHNPMSESTETFHALTRYDEVVEVSKRPEEFCSGKGAVSIFDMPLEMLEFFGSFINMDNPRHANQRRIVAHSFTPTQLQGVLESVESICTEVIDGFCEQGEVDLVEVLSQPFPLLIICDMMGIPRSEFGTVLDATNVILSGGDAEFIGDGDPMAAYLNAGIALSTLMGELIEERRKNPTDDLTSKLVHNNLPEDLLTPAEITSFFVLLAVAGNDTTRTAISHGVNLLAMNPDQRAIWQADVDGVTNSAVEEIVRAASPVTFMRRTATRDVSLAGQDFHEGDKFVMFYGAANRDPRVFDNPEKFDVLRQPNPHVGFGGPGPHFCLGANLARREVAIVFRELFRRLPDLEVTGPAIPLDAAGIPLVTGIKHLPVSFTPTEPVNA
ncbi:MAG: cytochrome P450 [Ilumatobacteraceae bacterium]